MILSMSKRNDISTPENYFENLQQRLSEIPARKKGAPSGAFARTGSRSDAEEGVPFFRNIRRLAPYAAIAASFLVAVMLGNTILHTTAAPAEDDSWTYVSYLADALDPDGAVYFDDAFAEEEGLSPEDIVNYLLADGISVEHLNYLSYEEGY